MADGMSNSPATDLRRGILPLVGYAVLTAAMDVYAGNRLQVAGPAAIAAVSFTLSAVFFAAVQWRRGGLVRLRALTAHRRDLVAINITTVVTWMSTFYALDYLEPAIVNVIGLALGPVIMTLAGPLLRRSSTVMATETAVALAICALLAVLLWGSFSGLSGLGDMTTGRATLGLVFTVVCAIGSALNIIYMKRLNDAGCDTGSVLATRFLLMIAVSWALVALDGSPGLGSAVLPGAIVALIGVGLPIYVLQVGIRHTEPITTSLLVCLSPLFAFAMQLADGRLRFSALTLFGVIAVVVLVALGVVARGRRDGARRGAPAKAAGAPVAPVAPTEPAEPTEQLASEEPGGART
ncbi:EamA family transporter [Kitasatospora sp. NPDC008115]|uniref:EamA family transporter n=1 Tax=Kitasatospora sp. NPDC008115 TaxID=3364022 RepID=UPI0036E88037